MEGPEDSIPPKKGYFCRDGGWESNHVKGFQLPDRAIKRDEKGAKVTHQDDVTF